MPDARPIAPGLFADGPDGPRLLAAPLRQLREAALPRRSRLSRTAVPTGAPRSASVPTGVSGSTPRSRRVRPGTRARCRTASASSSCPTGSASSRASPSTGSSGSGPGSPCGSCSRRSHDDDDGPAGRDLRVPPGGGVRPVYVAGTGLHPFGRFADDERHGARRARGARRAGRGRRRPRRLPGRLLRHRLRRRRRRAQGADRARARSGVPIVNVEAGLRERRRGARARRGPGGERSLRHASSSSASRRCRAA